jgi:GDP-4-dehydro-6-deoxy-D-mannose reductase
VSYLITGASGFVAGHLIEHIFRHDSEAVITCLDLIEPDYSFLDGKMLGSISFIKADLLSMSDLLKTLESARPRFIIHLASFSSVAYSWQHPIESFMNNSNIFLNLLEAVKAVDPCIRVLSVGSSEQYGVVIPEMLPLREAAPQNPVSPYAVARVAQEQMGSVFAHGFKLDIVSTRSFNHFGPRQAERFVLSGLARQVAQIKKGRQEPVIRAGDIRIIRDFIDVRDVVKAYLLLLRRGTSGEVYNVCSGTGRTIAECLDMLMRIADIRCEIKKSDSLVRPVDNPVIVGDNGKINSRTGWSPEISFEAGLTDLFEYWMARL